MKVTPQATAATIGTSTLSAPEPSSVAYDHIQPVVEAEDTRETQIPPVEVPVDAVPPPPVVEKPPAFSRTQFHQGHLHEFAPRIVVVGVGGGGGNAVNNMIANQLHGK